MRKMAFFRWQFSETAGFEGYRSRFRGGPSLESPSTAGQPTLSYTPHTNGLRSPLGTLVRSNSRLLAGTPVYLFPIFAW